jgi:hypothetical protein
LPELSQPSILAVFFAGELLPAVRQNERTAILVFNRDDSVFIPHFE